MKTIQELKEVLNKLIAQNEKKKQKNFDLNKGLSGASIATESGKIKDGFYTGKIQAYNYILSIIEKD